MSYTAEILQLALRGTNQLSSIAQVLNQRHRLKGGSALKDSNVRNDAKLASCTEFSGGQLHFRGGGKVNCAGCIFEGGARCPVPFDIVSEERRGDVDMSKGSDEFHPGRLFKRGEASAVYGKAARHLK